MARKRKAKLKAIREYLEDKDTSNWWLNMQEYLLQEDWDTFPDRSPLHKKLYNAYLKHLEG